jgi:hypothetical protein
MLSNKLAGKSIKEKIAFVRKEISICKVQYHTLKKIPAHVYYDQVEELYSVLHKLQKEDPLETFCRDNPSDLECRVYDN